MGICKTEFYKMFSCILYHYSKTLHKKAVSHVERIFDITIKRYGGKPHVSQTFYIDCWID